MEGSLKDNFADLTCLPLEICRFSTFYKDVFYNKNKCTLKLSVNITTNYRKKKERKSNILANISDSSKHGHHLKNITNLQNFNIPKNIPSSENYFRYFIKNISYYQKKRVYQTIVQYI